MDSWIQCNVTVYSDTEILSSNMFSEKLEKAVADIGQKEQSVRIMEEIGRTRLLVMLNAQFEPCCPNSSVSWKYLQMTVVAATLKSFSHSPFIGNSLPSLSVGTQLPVEQLLNCRIGN